MPAREKLYDSVKRLKAASDNLHTDFEALHAVDAAISDARAELADKVRGAIDCARVEHTRRQLEQIEREVRDALRILTEIGAYDEVIEAEVP
jgi:enolase